MVTQLQPGPTIGQAAGQGLQNAILPTLQQDIQRNNLTKALSELNQPGFENKNYTQQLSTLLPALLSVPGGAQVAGELLPVLNQRSQNKNYLSYLDQKRAQRGQKPQSKNALSSGNLGIQVEGPEGDIANEGFRNPQEQQFRNPQVMQSPESTTPLQTMENQVARPMNSEQIQDAVEDLMRTSAMQGGKPLSYGEANQIVQQDQANRLKQNELVEADKERREASFDKRRSEGLAQAKNSGIVKEPQDEPIFTRFLDEAKGAKNSNEQFIYAKNKFNEFNQARDSLRRAFDAPNPISGAYRKLTGTYQDKEQIIKSHRPQIDTYKRLGLIDELRNELSGTIGLGAEDIETAIFPPPKQQRDSWNNIPKNSIKPKYEMDPLFGNQKFPFPGEGFELPREKFMEFKENIANHLQKYPETNLLAFRGFLNQDRRYAWQDFSKAINELIEEGKFKPDQVQLHEKTFINNAPLPGMAQMFRNFLTETK